MTLRWAIRSTWVALVCAVVGVLATTVSMALEPATGLPVALLVGGLTAVVMGGAYLLVEEALGYLLAVRRARLLSDMLEDETR